jgi:solute carrier family 6 amino acid transporter-like protein 5/7/9/14
VFDGGYELFELVDTYSGGWNVLVISLCECIAIGWVYGVRRFLNDIECMVGKKVCGFMPWMLWKWWWAVCWCFLTPLGVGFILVFSWVDYTRIDKLPNWADALGWAMTLTVIVAIFGTMIVLLCMTPGSFGERIRYLTNPLPEWGPALPKHRALVTRYVNDFVVDPSPSTSPDTVQAKYYDNHAMTMYEPK